MIGAVVFYCFFNIPWTYSGMFLLGCRRGHPQPRWITGWEDASAPWETSVANCSTERFKRLVIAYGSVVRVTHRPKLV